MSKDCECEFCRITRAAFGDNVGPNGVKEETATRGIQALCDVLAWSIANLDDDTLDEVSARIKRSRDSLRMEEKEGAVGHA